MPHYRGGLTKLSGSTHGQQLPFYNDVVFFLKKKAFRARQYGILSLRHEKLQQNDDADIILLSFGTSRNVLYPSQRIWSCRDG